MCEMKLEKLIFQLAPTLLLCERRRKTTLNCFEKSCFARKIAYHSAPNMPSIRVHIEHIPFCILY